MWSALGRHYTMNTDAPLPRDPLIDMTPTRLLDCADAIIENKQANPPMTPGERYLACQFCRRMGFLREVKK